MGARRDGDLRPDVRRRLEHAQHADAMVEVDGVLWPCTHCWAERAGGWKSVDWQAFDAAYAAALEEAGKC